MINRLRMINESVIRHRGGGRDENGKLIAEGPPVTLGAIGVAPGGGSDRSEPARTGEDVDCTVYFSSPIPVLEDGVVVGYTDLTNSDELTVRQERFQIIVNEWRLSEDTPGGLEVLCTRGQG